MCISCLFETNDTFWQKNEKNQANWSEATIAPNSAMTAEIPPLFRTFLLTLPYWPTIATTSYNFTQLLVDWFIYLHFNIPVVMGCHGMSWDFNLSMPPKTAWRYAQRNGMTLPRVCGPCAPPWWISFVPRPRKRFRFEHRRFVEERGIYDRFILIETQMKEVKRWTEDFGTKEWWPTALAASFLLCFTGTRDPPSAKSCRIKLATLSCWMTLPKTMGRSGTPSGAPNQFQHRCAGHVGIGMYKPRDFTFVSVHSMPGLVSPNHPF